MNSMVPTADWIDDDAEISGYGIDFQVGSKHLVLSVGLIQNE